MNELVTHKIIDNFIDVLNRALIEDQEAITNLISQRVECNNNLANDETIQISTLNKNAEIGVLGLINGLCGKDDKTGYGYITAIYDKESKRITEFKRTNLRDQRKDFFNHVNKSVNKKSK